MYSSLGHLDAGVLLFLVRVFPHPHVDLGARVQDHDVLRNEVLLKYVFTYHQIN